MVNQVESVYYTVMYAVINQHGEHSEMDLSLFLSFLPVSVSFSLLLSLSLYHLSMYLSVSFSLLFVCLYLSVRL